MPSFYNPVVGYRRQSTDATGNAVNANGLVIGDNSSASTNSQEYLFNITGVGAVNLYRVGFGGTTGPAVLGTPVVATIPAGSRLQATNWSFTVTTAPTTFVGVVLTLSFNNGLTTTPIATAAIGGGLGIYTFVPAVTAAAGAIFQNTGPTDGTIVATLAATTFTGAFVGDISLQFTPRRGDGSIVPQGGAADPGTE